MIRLFAFVQFITYYVHTDCKFKQTLKYLAFIHELIFNIDFFSSFFIY